jgi:Kdo2-lipid IVA lauroyltransferase/acyltransferase
MLGLVRWLSRRSLRQLHALGGWVGRMGYALSPKYRRRLCANAALAGLSAAQRRASVAEAGRMALEMPRLWLRPHSEPIADPVRWENEAALESRLGQPGGLLILTPHLGSFEVAAQAYAQRYGARQAITVLYRPSHKPLLRELEETARARPHLATAPASLAGVRQMLRALKRGETVGMLPDQVPPLGQGLWAPFFGQPAYTMGLVAKLQAQTGAEIVALWCERLARGSGYVVHVRELAQALPAASGFADEAAHALACATAINVSMEALVRECPTQYLWGYQRYKQPAPARAGEGA